jgi:hypothetical protein
MKQQPANGCAAAGSPPTRVSPQAQEIVIGAGPANHEVRTLVHALGLGYTQYARERAEVLLDSTVF